MNHIPEESERGESREDGAHKPCLPDGRGEASRPLAPDSAADSGSSALLGARDGRGREADLSRAFSPASPAPPGPDAAVRVGAGRHGARSPQPGDRGNGAPDGRARAALPLGPAARGEEEAASGRAAPREKEDEKPRSGLLEALALVCVAFALALTLKSYVAEAYEIKGRSMEPSFRTGQRVIVQKAFYEVERFDVVVFASTEDPGKDLIKRVVGLPGDLVELRDGKVFVNGELLEESYVKNRSSYEPEREEEVPSGYFYVLGDNRPDSHDSRYFHSIPASHVKGEVILRWWPFEDFEFFVD